MKYLHAIICVCTAASAGYAHAPIAVGPQRLTASLSNDGVSVYVNGMLFTRYQTGAEHKSPFFYPLNGPLSGESVTVQNREPFPHHRSLFFGCDRVNGGNFWQEELSRGRIHSQTLELLEESGERVVFRNACVWIQGEHPPILRDEREVVISAPERKVRRIDFKITLVPLTDIRVERTNHSLFAARMRPELSVNGGGRLVNAHGDENESGTFGKPAPWCAYYGTYRGITEGLAIFQHPDNPAYPHPWFTRNYGFFSPTPLYWPPNNTHFDFAKGESIVLRYCVIVHAGDVEQAEIAARFEHYQGEMQPTQK